MGVYFLARASDLVLIIAGAVASVGEALTDPAATIVIGRVFKALEDVGQAKISREKFMEIIVTCTAVLAGIGGCALVCGWAAYVLWMQVGYVQGHRARSNLFRAIVNKSVSWSDSRGNLSGVIQMNYKDIQDVESATGITACEIMSMSVALVAQIAVAFSYSWAVTLVCFAGMPVLVVVGSIMSPPISAGIDKSKTVLDQISTRANWCLGALTTVKIFQRERSEWKMFATKLHQYQSVTIKYWFLFYLQQGIARAIVLSIFVQGFYFGSYMVKYHNLNAGSIITVFWACLSAAGLLQMLMQHVIDWNRGSVAAGRLKRALTINKEAELHESIGLFPKESTSGHVRFDNVVFSYPTRPELVLAGVTLEFEPGKTTYIIGPSGSGKSTLAELLTRQYTVDAGSITIDNHGIELLSSHWVEQNIYVVEQVPMIFDIPLFDNICIGSRTPESVTPETVLKACRDVCADSFITRLPDGLSTPGSFALSGGQRQRISLARARICDAPIIILDEATSAMDHWLQRKVMTKLAKWREGKTTIIVTHDMSIIVPGCTIYELADGATQKYSSLEELFQSSNQSDAEFNWRGMRLASPLTPSHHFSSHSIGRSEYVTKNLFSDASSDGKDKLSMDSTSSAKYHTTKVSVKHIPRPNGQSKPSMSLLNDLPRMISHMLHTSNLLLKSVPNKPLMMVSIIVTVVHAVINPVFAYVFSKLVLGIFDFNTPNITMWAMLVLMCAFLDGLVTFGKTFVAIMAEQWQTHVRIQLYDLLLSRNSLLPSENSYYMKLLMSDTEKCTQIITTYWPGVVTMLILGAAGFIWSLATGWRLTLVGLSLIPAFLAATSMYKSLSEHWIHMREARRANVLRLMNNVTAGFRTLKIMRLERYFGRFFDERERNLHNLSWRMSLRIGFGYGSVKLFPYALEALILYYGMFLVGRGEYGSQQTMTVFSMLMFTMVTIDQLTASIPSVGPGFEAVERLMKALNLPAEIEYTTGGDSYGASSQVSDWRSVRFVDVGIEHNNGTTILGGFTHNIASGSTVALMGPSGIGKSTIARLLERLDTPTVGRILIGGHDIQELSLHDVRQHIALVGQMPLDFFDGTIMENLMYALPDTEESAFAEPRVLDICRECGVDDFVAELSDGYDTRIKTGLLSGGQMQRLGIARAVIREPSILVLDECTSALDGESKAGILNMIEKLRNKRSTTIFIITHQLDVANVGDYMIHIE